MSSLLTSVWLERAKSRENAADLFSRTIEEFYEKSKVDRKNLREGNVTQHEILLNFVSNLKMARLVSGQRTASAIIKKAMRHANRKAEEEKARKTHKLKEAKKNTEEKEGNMHSLSVKKRKYPYSIPRQYVWYLPPGNVMNIVDRGISLKGLRTILAEYLKNQVSFEVFIQQNKDLQQCVRCPGESFVHMLVKPETRECDSYIEMLYGVYRKKVDMCNTDEEVNKVSIELDKTLGTVNVFVSHAWQYEFEMLVESIEEWESNWEKLNGTRHEPFFYFIDYLAVNQHNMAADLEKLQEVVQNSKVTCLVMSPWNNPIPLLRCWCIYEIAKTELYPSTRLSVAFPPHEIKRFKKVFFDSAKVHDIARIIESVDSAKAEASYPPDKKMIVKDIEENLGGFQAVNELCIRNLRKALIEKSCEFADDEAGGKFIENDKSKVTFTKALSVLKNVGTFLRQQGKFEKSVKYLTVAKKLMEERYCCDFDKKEKEDVKEKQDVKEEEHSSVKPPPFVRTWSAIKIGVDKKIEDTTERHNQKVFFLGILNSLANALTDVKQFEEAEVIYRETFKWRKELLTLKDKHTKMTQFNLGVCLHLQERFEEAEHLFNETLKLWTKNDKYYYWALFNLADLKSKTKRPEEADRDFHDACHGLRDICKVKPRDRFLSLANVLWARHLWRHADEKLGLVKVNAMLIAALEKVNFAYCNFCVNSDLSHPDTRLAARTQRRVRLKLNPALKDDEKKLRAGLMKDGTYDRVWNGPATPLGEQMAKNKIRVMHWNILADKLAYPDLKKGGFACTFDLLDWSRCRKDKICAEILKYDPDVLIVVELDHFEDIRFLLQEDYEYASVWKKKFGNFYADGTGIFWKKQRLQAGKIYKKALQDESGEAADQVFVAVEFMPNLATDDFVPFVAGGCHLKSKKKSIGEQKRLYQCQQILNILETEFHNHPIILGGDLNSEYKDMKYKALAYPFLIDQGLVSSYANVRGKEPEFTSWKFRIDEDNSVVKTKKVREVVKEFKYTIDYIFHSKVLRSLAVLEMPEEKEIDNYDNPPEVDSSDLEAQVRIAKKRCLLPNKRCASDHLSLVAEILLQSSNT